MKDKDKDIEFFEIFPWHKNFETGLDIVDEQHKKLVDILNQLAAHLANRSNPITLNKVFDELASYADYHFKTEEKIWLNHFKDDSWFTKHEHTHESFIDKVISIKKEEDIKPLDDVIQEIVSFLAKWLAFHILDSDKRMAIAVKHLKEGKSLEQAKNIANEEMSGATQILIETVLAMYDSLSTRTMDLMREKTLRKQAEQALQISEERWKFILEDGAENVWDWDIKNDSSNHSYQEASLFELTDSAQQKSPDKAHIHPADIKRVNQDLQDHLDGKTEFYANKYRMVNENGSWSWVSSRGKVVSRDEDGQALRMVGTHSDITERELVSLIYKNSSQAMFVTDRSNNIINANPAFTKMTGYSMEDVLGKNPKFLSSGKQSEDFYKKMWNILQTTGHWEGEIYNKRKNGETYIESLHINTIVDANGNIDHFIAMFSDITERKKTEETLRRAQKMDTIGQITGGISHDFNNLLGIILGNMDLLEYQVKLEDKAKLRLADMRKAGERAVALAKQLLGFSRRQTDKIIATNINVIIKGMNSLISRSVTPEIEIKHQIEPDLWLTNIDPGDFEDVLLNLTMNARDAMNGHGHLILKTSNSVLNKDFCDSNPGASPGEYVELAITDHGHGMTIKQQEHIFEPFFTTKEKGKGTGLGLAMVYSFITRSNGFIKIDSEIDVGTTFHIYLPKEHTEQTSEENLYSTKLSEKNDITKYKGTEIILIVDDEESLRFLAQELLQNSGYRVLTANDGLHALEQLSKEPNINLLFSDVVMPGGMNGYELAEQAKTKFPKLKILITSGYETHIAVSDNQKQFKANILEKPYSSLKLLKFIRAELDKV